MGTTHRTVAAMAAAAVVAGGSLLVGAGAASARPAESILCTYVVTGSNVRIHSQPNSTSSSYGLTQRGDTATAVQRIQNQYIYAPWPDTNGRRWNGWVSTSYAHASSCHRIP